MGESRVDVFAKIVVLGIGSYAVIAALQLWKINRIPKSDELKNAE